METLFKLTDKDGISGAAYYKPLQWAPGVTHEVNRYGRRKRLCGAGVIHAYESPLVAVFLNPAHANYDPARLWRCETDGKIIRDGEIKCGVHKLTCVEEMTLPEITVAQRVHTVILCAIEACGKAEWREWAARWLFRKDISRDSATWAAMAADAAEEVAVWTMGRSLNLHAIIEKAVGEDAWKLSQEYTGMFRTKPTAHGIALAKPN